jgi:hypothetical protein
MNKENNITRRKAIGGLGIGLAGMAISPNLTAATLSENNYWPLAVLEDPTTKYPRPPFNHQNQPWPALASKMEPRPDHGETSYKGSGRLMGRKALITGGDSGMGRAAAIAYAREGADVAIGYLPQEEPDAKEVIELIKKAGRKAVAIPGDIRDEAFCKKLVDTAVSQLGGLDILISNAARQQSTPSLTDLTSDQFDWTIKQTYMPRSGLLKRPCHI